MAELLIPISAVFGLIIGSFLSVCIYRIPELRDDIEIDPFSEKEEQAPAAPPHKKFVSSFNSPRRSICPQCGAQLKWQHNIPLISWLIQGGRCAFCKAGIPFRYPLVEILSASASVASFQIYGLTPTALVVFGFIAMLIVISVIDYDYYIIPNLITFPSFGIGVGISVLSHFTHWFTFPVVQSFWDCFWGVALGAGFLWAFLEGYAWLRKKEGLGMGDVKLMAVTGAFFGLESVIYTVFIGSVLGSIFGTLMVIIGRRKWAKPIPFGPYLAVGTTLYLLLGQRLVQWWIALLVPGQQF